MLWSSISIRIRCGNGTVDRGTKIGWYNRLVSNTDLVTTLDEPSSGLTGLFGVTSTASVPQHRSSSSIRKFVHPISKWWKSEVNLPSTRSRSSCIGSFWRYLLAAAQIRHRQWAATRHLPGSSSDLLLGLDIRYKSLFWMLLLKITVPFFMLTFHHKPSRHQN